MWWCIPVIPALGRCRQEDQEFKACLSCFSLELAWDIHEIMSQKTNKASRGGLEGAMGSQVTQVLSPADMRPAALERHG